MLPDLDTQILQVQNFLEELRASDPPLPPPLTEAQILFLDVLTAGPISPDLIERIAASKLLEEEYIKTHPEILPIAPPISG
jgi:hypothetical protein